MSVETTETLNTVFTGVSWVNGPESSGPHTLPIIVNGGCLEFTFANQNLLIVRWCIYRERQVPAGCRAAHWCVVKPGPYIYRW